MRAAVIAYTVNGAILAEKLRHLSDDETDIYVSAKSAKYIDAENIITFKSTPALIRDIFYQYEGIIFIGAAAIAVRSIAPYITSKFKDPAVLVMDDHAIHVISLLSGHVGGGNEWCVKVAGMFGSDAVITTATDVNNAFAVDVFAVKNHLKMINPYMIRDISTRIVNGEQLGIYMQAEEYEKVIQNECKKYSKNIILAEDKLAEHTHRKYQKCKLAKLCLLLSESHFHTDLIDQMRSRIIQKNRKQFVPHIVDKTVCQHHLRCMAGQI